MQRTRKSKHTCLLAKAKALSVLHETMWSSLPLRRGMHTAPHATSPPSTCKRQVHCAASNSSNGTAKVRRVTTIGKLIEKEGVLMLPGVFDAMSAKTASTAGHKAAFISGYAVSATLLGEPDLGLLTPPEMARKAGQVCSATPTLAIVADADTGGGGVLNVERTVKQLITAGCKGCFLEDQQWPKRMGHLRNECISMEEFAAKVYAARTAIGDADFFLVARTDARGTSAKYGLEDAIKRANLYMEAGADASFVEAPRNLEELAQIGQQTKGPRVCNMLEGGVTPLCTPEELKKMGFSLVVYPLSGLYAASRALLDVYGTLKTTGTTRDEKTMAKLAHFAEFNKLIGLEQRVATEEALTSAKAGGTKLHVKVRAPISERVL